MPRGYTDLINRYRYTTNKLKKNKRVKRYNILFLIQVVADLEMF